MTNREEYADSEESEKAPTEGPSCGSPGAEGRDGDHQDKDAPEQPSDAVNNTENTLDATAFLGHIRSVGPSSGAIAGTLARPRFSMLDPRPSAAMAAGQRS